MKTFKWVTVECIRLLKFKIIKNSSDTFELNLTFWIQVKNFECIQTANISRYNKLRFCFFLLSQQLSFLRNLTLVNATRT